MQDIEPDALAVLQSYAWPGNVRELENVIQRSIIVASGQTVRKEDLTLNTDEDETGEPSGIIDIGDYQPSGTFEQMLCGYKIRLAVAAVRENSGNKTLAARSLGISRAYLHRLIRLREPDHQFEHDPRQRETA
jgi:DNA-binding NtrC family response regulator